MLRWLKSITLDPDRDIPEKEHPEHQSVNESWSILETVIFVATQVVMFCLGVLAGEILR